MKTIITLLLINCFALTSLQAQLLNETPKINNNRLGYGAFIGLAHSYPIVSVGIPIHFEPQDNLLVGVDLRYTLNKRTSLHWQPTWLQSKNARSDAAFDPAIIYSISMLKLPLVGRYYVPDQKLFFIQAGASYNYLLNSSFSRNLEVECITAPCPVIYYTAFPTNKSMVSAIAGFGFNIELQQMSVPIVLQYERSINNYNFVDESGSRSVPLSFQSITLTTGFSF